METDITDKLSKDGNERQMKLIYEHNIMHYEHEIHLSKVSWLTVFGSV
jgi:hypothetical protein